MPMTRAELESLHQEMCEQARDTQQKKNHDYAIESDIFRNFRYFGGLGILVRMSDKLARLRSFEENGIFKVEDEKLADTIQDLINYAIIYYAFKQEGKPTPKGPTLVAAPDTKREAEEDPYAIKGGPYCEDCDELARYRHESGTFWCGLCMDKKLLQSGGGDGSNFTLMEAA